MFVGLRAEVTLYKGLLDKVMLKADVLKVGAYKSAVEPFIADQVSDANREQVTSMLDDHYQHELVNWMIAARPERKWTADQVKAAIDQGPFTASKALKLGLIDRIAYPDEFEGAFTKDAKAEISRNYGKPKSEEPDFSNPFAVELSDAGSSDDGRGDARVAQHPRQRQLGQRLAATRGKRGECPGVSEVLVSDLAGREEVPDGSARTGRDAPVEVPIGEHALLKR